MGTPNEKMTPLGKTLLAMKEEWQQPLKERIAELEARAKELEVWQKRAIAASDAATLHEARAKKAEATLLAWKDRCANLVAAKDASIDRADMAEAALNRFGGSPPPGTLRFSDIAIAQEQRIMELSASLHVYDAIAGDGVRAEGEALRKRIAELEENIAALKGDVT